MQLVKDFCKNRTYNDLAIEWQNQTINREECFGTDIDNNEFWRYITSLGLEPYCPIAKTTEEVNRYNFDYAISLGAGIPLRRIPPEGCDASVLEIGPGLGACRDWLKSKFRTYTGVDLISHFDDVLEIDGKNLPELQADFVFSTNVFQHLSVEQRRKYYGWISNILPPKHQFFFSIITAETFLYGQITEEQTYLDVLRDLHDNDLHILSIVLRYDNNIGILAQKGEITK